MSDAALLDWLNSGATPVLTADEAAAKRRQDFSRRFVRAMNPDGDLGPTEEEHQMGVAQCVFAVHAELNALGDEEYLAVWETLQASSRAALKKYISLAKNKG